MGKIAFGNYLTKLRTDKKLSQSELGAMVGVTNKAISKWENGEALPRLERLKMLATIFEISVEDLVSGGRLDSTNSVYEPKINFGKFDSESEEEKAKQYTLFLEAEEKRRILGKKLVILLFVANLVSVWLFEFLGVLLGDYFSYKRLIENDMEDWIECSFSAIDIIISALPFVAVTVIYVLIAIHLLHGKPYIKETIAFFCFILVIQAIYQMESPYYVADEVPYWYIVFVVSGAFVKFTVAIIDVSLLCFDWCRPVKLFLDDQAERYE